MRGGATTRVDVYGDLAALPSDIRDFIEKESGAEFFLSLDWFELLLTYSPNASQAPRIYVVRAADNEAIDCVLFAACERQTRKILSLTNFYTMSFAPVIRAGLPDPSAPLDALVEAIMRERPRWGVVELRSLIQEDAATALLMAAFRKAGMLVDTYVQFENWYYPTKDVSAEEYFKSRPSQLRNTITRKSKKLTRERKVDFTLYRDPEELSEGVADYETIYARSWKRPEAYPDFIPNLLRDCARRGKLRLGVLRIDNEPAAAQIWLLAGRKATIYKLAYDEKFAPLSVGSILTKLMFDKVLDDDKVDEVDYGVGSEPYKLDWMSARRTVIGLVGFNLFSLAGATAAARHLAGRLGRRIVKRERLPESGRRRPSAAPDVAETDRPAALPAS